GPGPPLGRDGQHPLHVPKSGAHPTRLHQKIDFHADLAAPETAEATLFAPLSNALTTALPVSVSRAWPTSFAPTTEAPTPATAIRATGTLTGAVAAKNTTAAVPATPPAARATERVGDSPFLMSWPTPATVMACPINGILRLNLATFPAAASSPASARASAYHRETPALHVTTPPEASQPSTSGASSSSDSGTSHTSDALAPSQLSGMSSAKSGR